MTLYLTQYLGILAQAIFAWSADQERQCKTGPVQKNVFHQTFHALSMLDSVRGQFLQKFSGMVSRTCLVHFCSTREDVVSVSLHIGSIATYRIVSFRGEEFAGFLFQHAFCFVCSSVRSTPTHRGQYCELCLSFISRCLFLRFVVRAKHANRAILIDVHVFCTSLQTGADSWTDDVKEHNDVTITSRMRPRFARKRFTTRQFVHRNRVTYRKSASIGAVEHNAPHSHLPRCERFVSLDLSCGLCEHVAKVVRCICHLETIPPVDTSHLQMCSLFAIVHLTSRSRSMRDLQT